MAAEVVGSVPAGEVGGVPAAVAASLRRLRGVERERAVRARRWSDARACDLATGDEALAVIEAAEAVKAWADSLALAATRRMVEVLDDEDDRYAAPRIGAAARAELADTAVSEIAAATGLGEREVSRRVALATGGADRSEPLLAAMRTRAVSLFRAITVHEATTGIETEDLPQVHAAVLAHRRDGTPPSPAQVRDRLTTQIKRHDPDAGERARTRGLRDRTAWVRPAPDGTAHLTVTGDAGRCTAAYDRADTIARALKAAGHGTPPTPDTPAHTPADAPADAPAEQDERTLAQLRSDVILDLILYGQVVAPAKEPATTSGPHLTVEPVEPVRPEEPVGACDLPVLGQLPPASVHLTMPLTTLLGADDDLGTVRGVGAVTAAHARELATAAGSIWRRLVTDPLTRRAITLDPRRYRPPTSVADDVRVRDGVCRGVGCTLDAWRCDLDHVIPWTSAGPTEPGNLVPLHRHHHQRKTRDRWRSHLHPDATLTWTSPLGRTYTNEPHTYGSLDPPDAVEPEPPPPF